MGSARVGGSLPTGGTDINCSETDREHERDGGLEVHCVWFQLTCSTILLCLSLGFHTWACWMCASVCVCETLSAVFDRYFMVWVLFSWGRVLAHSDYDNTQNTHPIIINKYATQFEYTTHMALSHTRHKHNAQTVMNTMSTTAQELLTTNGYFNYTSSSSLRRCLCPKHKDLRWRHVWYLAR